MDANSNYRSHTPQQCSVGAHDSLRNDDPCIRILLAYRARDVAYVPRIRNTDNLEVHLLEHVVAKDSSDPHNHKFPTQCLR